MMKVKYGDMTVNTREVYVNTRDSIIVHDRVHTYFFVFSFFLLHCMQKCDQSHIWKKFPAIYKFNEEGYLI